MILKSYISFCFYHNVRFNSQVVKMKKNVKSNEGKKPTDMGGNGLSGNGMSKYATDLKLSDSEFEQLVKNLF